MVSNKIRKCRHHPHQPDGPGEVAGIADRKTEAEEATFPGHLVAKTRVRDVFVHLEPGARTEIFTIRAASRWWDRVLGELVMRFEFR
jgi:hypothetical protein